MRALAPARDRFVIIRAPTRRHAQRKQRFKTETFPFFYFFLHGPIYHLIQIFLWTLTRLDVQPTNIPPQVLELAAAEAKRDRRKAEKRRKPAKASAVARLTGLAATQGWGNFGGAAALMHGNLQRAQ